MIVSKIMEIDFKDIENRIEKCSYLDALIENFLKTNKIHLSLIESKKHLDYTIIYLINKYPSVAQDINDIHNNNKSYGEKSILLASNIKKKSPYNEVTGIFNIVCTYAHLLSSIQLKITKPLISKQNKFRSGGKLVLSSKGSFEYVGEVNNIISYINMNISTELNKMSNHHSAFSYYGTIEYTNFYQKGETYNNFDKFDKKRDDVVQLLTKLQYNVKIINDE